MAELSRKGRENAARAAIEIRAGHALTEVEWTRVRARLIEFVAILRSWEHEVGIHDFVPCQPRAA